MILRTNSTKSDLVHPATIGVVSVTDASTSARPCWVSAESLAPAPSSDSHTPAGGWISKTRPIHLVSMCYRQKIHSVRDRLMRPPGGILSRKNMTWEVEDT